MMPEELKFFSILNCMQYPKFHYIFYIPLFIEKLSMFISTFLKIVIIIGPFVFL